MSSVGQPWFCVLVGCLFPSCSVGVSSNPDCLIFRGTLPISEACVRKQGDLTKCAPEPSPTIIYRSIYRWIVINDTPFANLNPDSALKMWYMFIMEYYSALKKDTPLFTKTWMNLEDLMLSEISWTQKTNTARSHLYMQSKPVRLLEAESREWWLPGTEGRGGNGEVLVKEYKVSFMQEE